MMKAAGMAKGSILKTILALVCILAPAPSGAADGGGRPAVKAARIYVSGHLVSCDAEFAGLFPDKVLGTIQSGLPAYVELFFQITGSTEGTVHRGLKSWSLGYDVWDDRYSVSTDDSTAVLSDLAGMKSMMQKIRGIPIIPVGRLDPDRSYRLQLSIAVNPLRGTDSRKIAGWINERVRSDDEGSWREQVLSINDLISWFFSRDDDQESRSEWFESGPFMPCRLPGYGDEMKAGPGAGQTDRSGKEK